MARTGPKNGESSVTDCPSPISCTPRFTFVSTAVPVQKPCRNARPLASQSRRSSHVCTGSCPFRPLRGSVRLFRIFHNADDRSDRTPTENATGELARNALLLRSAVWRRCSSSDRCNWPSGSHRVCNPSLGSRLENATGTGLRGHHSCRPSDNPSRKGFRPRLSIGPLPDAASLIKHHPTIPARCLVLPRIQRLYRWTTASP